MKTPFELRKLYKEETGNSFLAVEDSLAVISSKRKHEWRSIIIEEYIQWLESKANYNRMP